MSIDAINKALKILGVVRIDNKDEFDTLHLGRHRFVERWVEVAASRKAGLKDI